MTYVRRWALGSIEAAEWDRIGTVVGVPVPEKIRAAFDGVAGDGRRDADTLIQLGCCGATWPLAELGEFLERLDIVECRCAGRGWEQWDGRCSCIGEGLRSELMALLGSESDGGNGRSMVGAAESMNQTGSGCHYLPVAVDRSGRYYVVSLDGPAVAPWSPNRQSPVVRMQGGKVPFGLVGVVQNCGSAWTLVDVDGKGGSREIATAR